MRSVTVGTLFWMARQNGWRAERVRPVRPAQLTEAGGDNAPAKGNRPEIRIYSGFMPEAIDKGEQALLTADLGFYQRGSLVVRPAMVPVSVESGQQMDVPRLVHVKAPHMAEAFTKVANWKRFDKRAGEWLNADCPQRLAETYLAREGQSHLPVLTGIINCPTLRPDGSILDLPGYDAQTGLLFDAQGDKFPAIQRDPSRDTALSALNFLRDLISTFPFVTRADRSVALSAILTTLIRRSLDPFHN